MKKHPIMPGATGASGGSSGERVGGVDRGELLLGGPLTDAVNRANVLLFQSDTAATAEAFAKADPYVQHGIVTQWRARPWQTVVGPGAASPVAGSESDRPKSVAFLV